MCHLYGLGTVSAIFGPEMASEAISGLLISLKLVRAYATGLVAPHSILGPAPEIARYQLNMPIVSSAREATVTVATHSRTKLYAQIMS